MTLKFPQLEPGETDVSGMVISTGLVMHRPELFTVAPVKLTVPKLVSGRMPPR